MKKLKVHGIDGHLLRWISAWLTNTRQGVVLNGKQSSWEEVLSGVGAGQPVGAAFLSQYHIGVLLLL
jgi:hypothetical protein